MNIVGKKEEIIISEITKGETLDLEEVCFEGEVLLKGT